MGLAVIGDKLVPNLASRTADRADRTAAISEERLRLAEEAAGRAAGGNKLTLSEVTSKGLPASLVGVSEKDVANSFYSPTAPDWFVEKFLAESPVIDGITIKAPFSPLEKSYIQKAWNNESQQYVAGTTGDTNLGKATSYFKNQYPTLDGAAIKTLTDQVQNYINGGKTYSAAVTQVEADNS